MRHFVFLVHCLCFIIERQASRNSLYYLRRVILFMRYELCLSTLRCASRDFTVHHVISRAGKLKPGMGKFRCVDQDGIKKISVHEYFHQYRGKNGVNSWNIIKNVTNYLSSFWHDM